MKTVTDCLCSIFLCTLKCFISYCLIYCTFINKVLYGSVSVSKFCNIPHCTHTGIWLAFTATLSYYKWIYLKPQDSTISKLLLNNADWGSYSKWGGVVGEQRASLWWHVLPLCLYCNTFVYASSCSVVRIVKVQNVLNVQCTVWLRKTQTTRNVFRFLMGKCH